MNNLEDRVALITGSGSGIGKAIALKFAVHGARVAVVDINEKYAQATVKEIEDTHGNAVAVPCDVTDIEQVKAAIDMVLKNFNELHILVNSAGISPLRPIAEITLDEWNRVLAVNLTGPFLMVQSVWSHLTRAGNKGRVINIGSIAGQIGGIAVGLHYTASKGGLMAMTKQLAKLFATAGVTVNNIAPGTADTPMVQAWPEETRNNLIKQIPLGRLAEPEDIANAALFLVSDEAQFITGATINVNGGMFSG